MGYPCTVKLNVYIAILRLGLQEKKIKNNQKLSERLIQKVKSPTVAPSGLYARLFHTFIVNSVRLFVCTKYMKSYEKNF